MKKEKRKVDAVSILHRRYIGDDAERKASLQEERVNGEVARMIYELRNEAGLKQKELAELIGTTQLGPHRDDFVIYLELAFLFEF